MDIEGFVGLFIRIRKPDGDGNAFFVLRWRAYGRGPLEDLPGPLEGLSERAPRRVASKVFPGKLIAMLLGRGFASA